MNRMNSLLLALTTLSLTTSAAADHLNANLKDFRAVCINTTYEVRGQEDDAVNNDLFDLMIKRLQDAGIPLAPNPCQEKSTPTARHLNLLYTFTSTKNGAAYMGMLDGWLATDGKYIEPSLWMDYYYGVPGKDALEDLAFDVLNDTLDAFTDAWKQTH
ncbi:hypothetical protein ACFFLM_25545 [Deinococcus oregonensis]|uniref:Uncharacterized protein n=1 Tax=Deinococcus oregonensis TaxID=1805970 RepID=A0ABV6B7T6_9DEIO